MVQAGGADNGLADDSSEADPAEEKKAAVADSEASPGGDGGAAGPQSWTTEPLLDADMAIVFEQMQGNMACLMSVHKELQSNGLMKETHATKLAIATEWWRPRGLAKGR